ncbi:hypothetical protein [Escherichia coli]|nr:hypothetical protein [Escherichia coli]
MAREMIEGGKVHYNGQPIAIYPVEPQQQVFLSWRLLHISEGIRRR